MKNILYENYTMGCQGKTEARMQTAITPLSTDDEIRSYMFSEHNQRARQEIHKVTPYHIDDPRISKAISPEFLKELEQKGIHLPKLKEFVIFHASIPVDTMNKEELSKYISQPNENSRLRQPAA